MRESLSSSLALKSSAFPVLMSLKALGMQLKSWAPLTFKEASLAFLTDVGALGQREPTCMSLPLLALDMKVPLHKPQENYLVPFPSSFLWVQSQGMKPFPVVFTQHAINLGGEVSGNRLKLRDGGLVTRRPELATVVQVWLYK